MYSAVSLMISVLEYRIFSSTASQVDCHYGESRARA